MKKQVHRNKKIWIAPLVFLMACVFMLSGCDLIGMTEKTPLDTPVNVRVDGTLLSWDAVDNAVGYRVKIGDDIEEDCNDSQYELAQLSLAAGQYDIMVKARGGNNFIDSDYSVAVQYIKTDSGNGPDVSLEYSTARYVSVSAPLENNAPPLIASSTDYTHNYYLVDGGYIKNVPISSGATLEYNGQTAMTVRFEQSSVTTSKVEESMAKTVSESVSETGMNEFEGKFSYETGALAKVLAGKFSVGLTYTRKWGTVTENAISMANTYTVASEAAETLTQSLEFTIGNNGEKKGAYRLSMVTTCDVYYLVTTDRENTELTEFEMILCARPGVKYVLEYDERGEFGKTAGAQELDWPEDFYRNYVIPTEGYPCTIALDVAGGYALEQSTVSVNLGASYELPVPVRYNYAFVGWYSLPGGEGIRYTGSDGKSYENWSEPADRTLYAHWTSTVGQVNLGQIELRSQEIYSQKSEPFSIGLDIEALRSAGYRYLNIGIAGLCSGYDYRMNERGRYFVLSDVLGGDLLVWSFKVKNFSGVDGQNIALDSLNANGQYQLQLVSDKSPAYDEKLTVSSLVITIKAVK